MFDEQNLPPGLEREDWDDLVAHREQIGKPMTDVAKKRMLKRLKVLYDSGENLSEAIEQTINSWGQNGPWTNVWPVKRKDTKPQAHQDAKKPDLPEVDDEKAAENIRKLQESLGEVINISGGRR